jgi:hypothetical protein
VEQTKNRTLVGTEIDKRMDQTEDADVTVDRLVREQTERKYAGPLS